MTTVYLRRITNHLKFRYLPLLAIYFANGLYNILSISQSFWFKEDLTVTPYQIVEITFWINIPYACKLAISQFIDSYSIMGSRRSVYVYIGALLMIGGFSILALMSNNYFNIRDYYSDYLLLTASGLLIRTGLIVQDLIADTLCVEVVETTAEGPDKVAEIHNIQLLATIARATGSVVGAGLGGLLAEFFSYAELIWIDFLIPVLSVVGILLIPENKKNATQSKFNWQVALAGFAYLISAITLGFADLTWSQELIFLIGTGTNLGFILYITRGFSSDEKKALFAIMAVVFIFRVTPSYGEGVRWWKIDELGFNPQFFGLLNQITAILSFIGLWVFKRYFRSFTIAQSLLIISLVFSLFEIPILGMAYGMHEWTAKHLALGPKALALIDTTGDGLTFYLVITCFNMVIAQYAPSNNRVTWFAANGSLMSIAYSLGNKITTKWVNEVFVISRCDYHEVSALITAVWLLKVFLPTLAIILIMRPFRKEKSII